MKTIEIKGKSFRVDDDVFEQAKEFKWHLVGDRPVCAGLTLGRFIMNAPAGTTVVYKDGDTSNNLRSNFKLVDKKAFQRFIGSKGGKLGTTGGFAADRERAREAGRKGGLASSRRGIPNGRAKIAKEVNDVYESGILG